MTRSRLVPLLCVVSLYVAATGGCGGLTSGDGDDAITIGALYPISGRQGPGGIEEERGARLAVELANRDGGVRGRPLRLETKDVDSGSAAPQAVRDFRDDGVRLLLGSYGSTISAPAAVAAEREGMVFWETGAVGETTPEAGGGRSFFRLAPHGANLGRAGVAFVRDQLSPQLSAPAEAHRYAVAYVDDAYGRAVGLGAVEEIRDSGEVLAGVFPYDVHSFDAADVARRIGESGADVLFVSAYLDDGIAIRRATIDAHLPLVASVGTSSSYCMPAFAAALGPGAVGLFASDKPDAAAVRADALKPEGRRTLEWARSRYRQQYDQEMTAAALAGFANTWALVAHVLPAASGLAPAEVAAAAVSVDLEPGTLANGAGLDLAGPGQVDAGENRGAVSVIWQWVDAETQAVVWPPTFATRPLQAIPIQR